MTRPDETTGGEPQETDESLGAPRPGSFGAAAGEMANETEVEAERSVDPAAAVPQDEPVRPQPPRHDPVQNDPASDMVEEGDPLTVEREAAADPLAATQAALAERTVDLQRLQAEYVNYKRRVDRDRELVKQNATVGVLAGLLPVLDDIDRAREHGEVEGGFKAVADSLERIVSSLGLSRFGAKGEEFDPNVHEALMHGHSGEVTTTTVDVVAQAGYRIGDRVVRAAKVTVLDPE